MTDSWVAVPDDSTGKKLRTDYSSTGGGTTVHTEYVRADHSPIVASNSSFAVSVPGIVRVQNLTAASFLVTTSGGSGFRNVTSITAASFNVTVAGAKTVLSPTAASFNAIAQVPGRVRVYSETAASFLVTSTGGSGFRNVTSNTAASFNVTVAGAKTVLSPTAASFNVTAPGYVRAQNPTYASFLAQAAIPGVVRVTNLTAASFLVTSTGGSGFRNVTSDTAASFNTTSYLPGVVRVTNLTAASFLVTSTGGSGFRNVTSETTASFRAYIHALSPTAASFLSYSAVYDPDTGLVVDVRALAAAGMTLNALNALVGASVPVGFVTGTTYRPVQVGTADPAAADVGFVVRNAPTAVRQNVLSGSAASFNITAPGYVRAQNPTTAASLLGQVNILGYARIQSDTAASALITAKSLSLTAGSFNATVLAPGYVRAQNPTTAASFLNKAYSYSVTAASFNVTVAGAKNVLSATAASFNVAAANLFTARSTWPTAEANGYTGATAIVDLQRRLVISPYCFPEKTMGTTITVTTTVPVVLFGATANERNYLTTIMASNSSATATRVDVYDRTTAGRELVNGYIAASGGGFALPILVPIRGNTNSTVVVRVTPTVTSVFVTAFGYSAP